MYIEIAMFAYFVVLFLTLRDVRIFKRTGYRSYRKGAMKGLAASSVVFDRSSCCRSKTGSWTAFRINRTLY